jgi:hypothetical protein
MFAAVAAQTAWHNKGAGLQHPPTGGHVDRANVKT